MKPLLFFFLLLITTSTTVAQSLNNYRWKSRLVLVFTPTPDNNLFEEQVRVLKASAPAFEERDVLFFFITPKGKFENTGRFLQEADAKKFYDKFGVSPHRLELVLVGLDGTEKFRAKNKVTPAEDLMGLIDGMPMRRQELREKRNKNGG